jgi:hypothetical protein
MCLMPLGRVARVRHIGAERFYFLAVQETEARGGDE